MPTRNRAGTICINDRNEVLLITLEDPVTRVRFASLPGGKIEPGESAADAAVRETLEETGYQVALVDGQGHRHEYDFVWSGSTYACTTWWFLANPSVDVPEPVTDDAHVLGCYWFALPALRDHLAYHAPTRDFVLNVLQSYLPKLAL